MRVAGIDGYKGGWMAVVVDSGAFSDATLEWSNSLEDLIKRTLVDFYLVDIPIGLSSGPADRLVESSVRKFLTGKTSSVFNAPCRQALDEVEYPEASRTNFDVLGKKLSKQTWAIVPKIKEADVTVGRLGGQKIAEGHPEVSFALLMDKVLVSKKRSAKGLLERLSGLTNLGFDFGRLAKDLPIDHPAAADDVLDAAVLSWSAWRVCSNNHKSFPPEPQFDAHGVRMAILA